MEVTFAAAGLLLVGWIAAALVFMHWLPSGVVLGMASVGLAFWILLVSALPRPTEREGIPRF